MMSRRTLIVVLVVVLILAGGGYAYYKYFHQTEEVAAESTVQTSRARRGDLILYVSGSGTLVVEDEIDIAFGTSGKVAELYVQTGDQVQAGDVLAVQADRDQLEASVASDELAVREAQQALDDLYENAELVAAQAQLELAQAKDALQDAEYARYVQQEGNRASQSTIDAAKAELVLAEQRLEAAREDYNLYYGRPKDDPARALATTRLASAQNNYDSALRNLNWYLGHPTENQQALLDADVAVAQAQLDQAERNYELVKDGPDPDEVDKAELELTNAQAKLSVSQSNLDESIITAPVYGTILSVTASVGQEVSGTLITMADLSHLYMEIYLDETDMASIDVGYEVDVTFDALPDDVFTGHVIQVDPSLYRSGMVSAVRGMAIMDENSALAMDRLLIGMNASVDVVSGRAEDVILVPVEALRELSPGEYAVFVQGSNGELKLRPVEVGLMDVTFAEIKSGLEEGEIVSTGIVETQ
jgi:RND family efflux transporter MFP subunit